jgi:hypothetical protein
MESLLLVTAHYYWLLLITAQYFRLKSLLPVSAHYYSLLPITSFNVHIFTLYFYCSNGLITASLPRFITTYSRALLPLLPITSISLLIITSITAYYFHIWCYITTSLLLNYDLNVHYFPLLPLFHRLLHRYCIITASLLYTVEHYCHYCPLLRSHYPILLPLLPFTSPFAATLLPHYCH